MKTPIIIPTRGRFLKQTTRRAWFLDEIDYPVIYVVPEFEESLWKGDCVDYRTVSDDWDISKIRQYIALDLGLGLSDRIISLDDDLLLNRRRHDGKLTKVDKEDVLALLAWMETQMEEGYVHGGVGIRFQNNRRPETETCCAAYNALFFRTDVLSAEKFDYTADGVLRSKSDSHFVLSLLEWGYPNIVTHEWAQSQSPEKPESEGLGWYRGSREREISSKALCRLHPESVRLRDVYTKQEGWITETTNGWKKSLGLKEHLRKWNT